MRQSKIPNLNIFKFIEHIIYILFKMFQFYCFIFLSISGKITLNGNIILKIQLYNIYYRKIRLLYSVHLKHLLILSPSNMRMVFIADAQCIPMYSYGIGTFGGAYITVLHTLIYF